jgi:TetR/AcrR family transcriptional regulator, cholesterol catabolism regulator
VAPAEQRTPRETTTDFTDQNKILTTAARLFRNKGYHGTSMHDIADKVGILKGSLYHHIDSKEQLLLILLRASVQDVLQAVRKAARGGSTPRERLYRVIKAELETMAKHQDEILIWLTERGRMRDTLAEITTHARAVDEVLRSIIQEGIKTGIWHKSSYPLGYQAIQGMITSFASWYRPRGTLSVAEIADRFTIFADGILSTIPKANRPR